jgi:transcription-repair coupling factor (superfamily II helicase)
VAKPGPVAAAETDEPRFPSRLDFEGLARVASARSGYVHVLGARGLATVLWAVRFEAWREKRRPLVFVSESLDQALARREELLSFLPEARIAALPLLESTPYDRMKNDRRTNLQRLSVLDSLASGEVDVLCLAAPALVRRVLPPDVFVNSRLVLEVGGQVQLDALAAELESLGYERTPLVEDEGGISIRGSLIDVWPPGLGAPLRIELDFDTVLSILPFDPETQARATRSEAGLKRVTLPLARSVPPATDSGRRARARIQELADHLNLPTREAKKALDSLQFGGPSWNAEALLPAFIDLVPITAYLGPNTLFVFDRSEAVARACRAEAEAALAAQMRESGSLHFEAQEHYLSLREVSEALAASGSLVVCFHESEIQGVATEPLEELEYVQDPLLIDTEDQRLLSSALAKSRENRGHGSPLEPLLEFFKAQEAEGRAVVLSARSQTQAERLGTLLSHRGVRLERLDRPPLASTGLTVRAGSLSLWVAPLAGGVIAPSEGLSFLTEEEVFGVRRHTSARKNRTKLKTTLDDLRSLEPGDYVIHVEHGIGRYLGLEHKRVGESLVDFFVVEYLGGDKLFVPVYRLNLIQKHAGGEARPKLDRLGGQTFEKTKAKARKRAYEMADQLLSLYAERLNVVRPPLPPPADDYRAFEAEVPFDETPDQADAIAEVLSDLQKPRVMDRLVSGDVGFGKTEVALRAAYLMALANRQTALLCPTTVLAEQHFRTFAGRMAHLGVEVRALSRFTSAKEQTEILLGLKNGHVDVVIGTHRLLSTDVHFKNLGLLVIDEEQRFGVAHKERMKSLRRDVDVLTLSATPIPRTLSMAVGGLRDMSVIATPPETRRAIRTFVASRDNELVRTAIERELKRGGQIYYVVNRIDELYARANELKELVPGLRLRVVHGQMSDRELEKTMLSFVDGEADLLAATTIIESGLDISRANTIFIERADTFGLAQLYQIRGRVGRSSERAYCYLLVPPPSELSREATLRLDALTKHTELGSGFQIASLDMELRGAGDLLGGAQSGVLESVGFELFSEMLESAARELSGQAAVRDVDPELSVDVEALLPETYVDDIGVRLSLYKRLSGAPDEAEIERLAAEMSDRFGTPPSPALALVELMRLKVLLRNFRALGMNATKQSATLHLRSDTPLLPELLVPFISKAKGLYTLSPDGRLTRRASKQETLASGLVHADRMLSELAALLPP